MKNEITKLGLQYFAEPTEPAAEPTEPTEPPTEPVEPPAKEGKVYTEQELAELKADWLKEQEELKKQETDFDKMTPEQQAKKLLADKEAEASELKAKLEERDLSDYARDQLSKNDLPPEMLDFAKGKDNSDTDERIKTLKDILAKSVQSGVEKRFKANGYTPKTSAAGATGAETKTKSRGVEIITEK